VMASNEEIVEERHIRVAQIRKSFYDLLEFFKYYNYQKESKETLALYDSISDRLRDLECDNPPLEVK